ncbi:phospholipase A [Sphingobium sp. AP49]|uniref:phospholipase A n=1 Tax=Sphingobium sp. AP49 TaxID=1144307 RepID=UPI00026ECD3F|nr:phospholipase A [Sphingobium sp. AP49]WHO39671.1 phospholipase A [Sphingobium sp. AP49]
MARKSEMEMIFRALSRNRWILVGLLLDLVALAPSAQAAGPVEILVAHSDERASDGALMIALRLLNDDAVVQHISLPDRVEARLDRDGDIRNVWLERASGTPADLAVPPHGFVSAAYRLAADQAAHGGLLSIPQWRVPQTALAPAAPVALAVAAPALSPAPMPPPAAPSPADRTIGNAFLDNMSAYEPIYGAYGPGTNSDARLQISFKYQLFGSRERADLPASWRDGLYLAYTQRMFWDVAAQSSPFRNIDYQPEIIYIAPSTGLSNGLSLSAQVGARHESNGRDGAESRSINSLYIAPMVAVPLSGKYRLIAAPRLSFYVGDKSDNPDIADYRGHSALFLEVGDDEGLRLSTQSRLNFSTGKGAVNAELSYPLPRLLGGGPDIYLFAQGFAGYGENLLDYRRQVTRLRIGFALVR